MKECICQINCATFLNSQQKFLWGIFPYITPPEGIHRHMDTMSPGIEDFSTIDVAPNFCDDYLCAVQAPVFQKLNHRYRRLWASLNICWDLMARDLHKSRPTDCNLRLNELA